MYLLPIAWITGVAKHLQDFLGYSPYSPGFILVQLVHTPGTGYVVHTPRYRGCCPAYSPETLSTLVQLIVLETSNNPDHTHRSLLLVQYLCSTYIPELDIPNRVSLSETRFEYTVRTQSNIFPERSQFEARPGRKDAWNTTQPPIRPVFRIAVSQWTILLDFNATNSAMKPPYKTRA